MDTKNREAKAKKELLENSLLKERYNEAVDEKLHLYSKV